MGVPRGRPPQPNWQGWQKHPPEVVGQITLDVYDQDLWNGLAVGASEREVSLALYVHVMLRHVAARSERIVAWRREQDARDPDLVEIRRFLDEFDESKAS